MLTNLNEAKFLQIRVAASLCPFVCNKVNLTNFATYVHFCYNIKFAIKLNISFIL